MADQPRTPPRCSICGGPQEPWHEDSNGYGNNAWPINNGRCCNTCNALRVIPARVAQLTRKDDPSHA